MIVLVPILISDFACDIVKNAESKTFELGLGGFKYELKFPVISRAQSAQRSLAQLVAHPLDVREVTSSSLVSSTTENHGFPVVFFVFQYIQWGNESKISHQPDLK